jgi:hypothetical protein
MELLSSRERNSSDCNDRRGRKGTTAVPSENASLFV